MTNSDNGRGAQPSKGTMAQILDNIRHEIESNPPVILDPPGPDAYGRRDSSELMDYAERCAAYVEKRGQKVLDEAEAFHRRCRRLGELIKSNFAEIDAAQRRVEDLTASAMQAVSESITSMEKRPTAVVPAVQQAVSASAATRPTAVVPAVQAVTPSAATTEESDHDRP